MAKIFAQDVIEIALNHTYAGRPIVNVLHVKNDETGGSDEQKVRDVVDNWQDHIVGRGSNGITFTGADWRSLDPSEGDVGTAAPDPAKPVTGTQTGEGIPGNNAIHVRKITEGRMRGQRDGRIFICGVPENAVDRVGNLTDTFLAHMQAGVDSFLAGVNDTGVTMGSGSGLVVLNTTPESRMKGTHEVTLTYRLVSGLAVDRMIASQRDRLR